MSESPIHVLFVLGKGRSGSTLLDVALGELPGFFSLGEAFWVDNRPAPLPEERCGCGRPVGACPVWSRVIPPAVEAAVGHRSERAWREMERCQRAVIRWRAIPRLLTRNPDALDAWPELEACRRYLAALYARVAEVTGARVLVDSSKWPGHPGPLGLVSGIEPRAVHLVRDPRAVAFSWQRDKRYSRDGAPMPVFGPTFTALSWNARNLASEWVIRRDVPSVRIRYEDLVAHPRRVLETALELVDGNPSDLPLRGERTLQLGVNHALRGNPARFETGRVEIRPDVEWRTELGARTRSWISCLTFPLMKRYGYPLRRQVPRRRS